MVTDVFSLQLTYRGDLKSKNEGGEKIPPLRASERWNPKRATRGTKNNKVNCTNRRRARRTPPQGQRVNSPEILAARKPRDASNCEARVRFTCYKGPKVPNSDT
jgi:hypothetical protein